MSKTVQSVKGMRDLPPPVKLFYIGPQFRYERPQQGRYRQFYQIGAEQVPALRSGEQRRLPRPEAMDLMTGGETV